MKKLIVKEINNYNYILIDDMKRIYILNIEFYSKYKPQVNDIMYIDEEILKEKSFFSFDEVYETKIENIKDFIKVINNDKEYYFQRVYG